MRSIDVADALGRAPAAVTAPRFRDTQIEMAHGAGGKASRRLLETLIVPLLGMPAGATRADAAHLCLPDSRVAFTADSFVVRPLQFPGGSIGDLAVNGTVNDLAVSGAQPMAMLLTLIVEAGLPSGTLEAELRAVGRAAAAAGTAVVGGDTKVVEHGHADGLYMMSAGIGVIDRRFHLSPTTVRPGDRIVLSGTIGDHGITVLLARGDVDLNCRLQSDTRSVWPLVAAMAAAGGEHIRWMRDPTRGGVATALNELARDSGRAIALDEAAIPVRDEVRGACELLGLDPLHIANEGCVVAIVAPEAAEAIVAALRECGGGERAVIVGEVTAGSGPIVTARSSYGSSRVIDMLVGDPLPRIC
jgi:hydrogenase expression/formation protein HypE